MDGWMDGGKEGGIRARKGRVKELHLIEKIRVWLCVGRQIEGEKL